jgi:hypothetical protein
MVVVRECGVETVPHVLTSDSRVLQKAPSQYVDKALMNVNHFNRTADVENVVS